MEKKLKAHLFICTNSSDKKETCSAKGSENLHRQVKAKCKQAPWADDVRINKSGCLGHCEKGIVAVLYPQGEWFFECSATDDEKLFTAVEALAGKR